METYKASLDTAAKIITGFIFGIVVIFIVLMVTILLLSPPDWYIMPIVVAVYCILIITMYIYSIQSYQLTNERLIINRPFVAFNKEFFLTDIESARLLTEEDSALTIRIFGNGGLFGYTGYYANRKLGSFKMYATNRKNKVLIVMKNDRKIVITPDDTTMADTLQKRLQKVK